MILWAKKYLAGQFCRNCVSNWLKVIHSQNEIVVSSKLPKIWLTFWEIWAKIHSEINWPLSWLPLNWNNFWRSILFFSFTVVFTRYFFYFHMNVFWKSMKMKYSFRKNFNSHGEHCFFFLIWQEHLILVYLSFTAINSLVGLALAILKTTLLTRTGLTVNNWGMWT